jgi:predicted dehydrogenase
MTTADGSRLLRWGFLSTANIARKYVIPATQADPRSHLLALASRSIEDARRVAAEHGIERAYGSYDALLSDPDIDAIYIGMPNHLHHPWTMKAIAAGKHVLCEKPFALNHAQAVEMIDAASAAHVVVAEAFMYRTHPSWRAVRQLVAEGRIGELRAVQAWFSYFNDDPTNVRNVAEWGGGAVYDIGCYAMDVAQFCFDAPLDGVTSHVIRDEATGVDVVASGSMQFGTQGVGSWAVSMRTRGDQHVDLYGSTGHIRVEIPFNVPTDKPARIFVSPGSTAATKWTAETVEFPTTDQYCTQAGAFVATVFDGAPLVMPHEHTLALSAAIDSVLAQ